jgi:hypothetical protein
MKILKQNKYLCVYIHMAKKYTITNLDRLKMAKKVSRETNIMPKPMVTTDKKKKQNKLACRKKIAFD